MNQGGGHHSYNVLQLCRMYGAAETGTLCPQPCTLVKVGPGAQHTTCCGAKTGWEPSGLQEQCMGLKTPQEITMSAAYGCAQCEKSYLPPELDCGYLSLMVNGMDSSNNYS